MRTRATNLEYRNPKYLDKKAIGVDKTLGSAGRDWQVKILGMFKDSRFSELTCPCGAGKSTAQVGLAIQDVIESKYERLQLFVMPQTHIAEGFFKKNGEYTTIRIGDQVYTVSVSPEHNFCSASSIKRLKKLLVSRKGLSKFCRGNVLSGLFAMTSNHALAYAWNSMSAAEKQKAVHNLHLRCDESHHLAMGGDDQDANNLGKIANYILESPDTTARLTFSTATNFRGDQRNICSPAHRGKFTKFALDWIEHWKTIGIRDLFVSFDEFAGNPVAQVVDSVARETNEYHYIAVPPSNAGWRQGYGKSEGVNKLVAALKKKWPACRILNLVPQEEQHTGKSALLNEPKTADDGLPQFDVVITCMLGREGTDWCPCSRLHVTYPEGSITLAVQTLGRLLRRFKGKTKAFARYYYPEFPDTDELTKSELLDDRKNALLLMTQIDEQFFPILFPSLPREGGKTPGDRGNHMGTLEALIGSQAYIALKRDFLSQAADYGLASMDSAGSGYADALADVIDSAIDSADVPEEFYDDAVETLQAIWLRCASPKFRGINISFVRESGFHKLVAKTTKFGRTLIGHHDVRKMERMREIVRTTADEKVAEIGRLMDAGKIRVQSDWRKYPKLRQWMRYAVARFGAKQ